MTSRVRRRLQTGRTIGRLLPAYASFAVLKRLVSLERLVRWAWRSGGFERDAGAEGRAIAAVIRLRRWFGRDTDCLQSSLVLYRELSRLGARPVLEVGFRNQGGTVQGHAWVAVDGRAVFKEDVEGPFLSTLRFGPGGTRMDVTDPRYTQGAS